MEDSRNKQFAIFKHYDNVMLELPVFLKIMLLISYCVWFIN